MLKRVGAVAGPLAVGVLALGVMSACVKKEEPKGDAAPAQPAAQPAQAATEDAEILFGEYGSLTGSEATFGQSTKQGVELAVKELNAAGGVLGKKIRVIVYDDQGKGEEAVTAVAKLVTQDKVHVVLGEVASTRSMAAAPTCQQNGVPMISPSSTNPKVTQVGDYIFRVCFIDPFQGTVMAEFAANHLKIKNVAIFRDKSSDYSMGLADFFQKEFMARGGVIVADEAYNSDDKDFRAQLTSIKGKKPDAIFVPGYYTQVGMVARQAKELKLDVPLLGGDGWESSKLFEIGGAALNGSYYSNHLSSDDPRPELQGFVTRYKAAYGEPPDSLAALGFDSAMLAADAIKRAGKLDRKAIRDELAKTTAFAGVSGTVSMDAQRNATKPAVVLKINDGKATFVTSIAPK
jgi:branched-chain amino acid transport system substrate-binding protein